MNILFLESFYGGSHKNFADGLKEFSKHSVTLMTLPARHWKWRVRGAALYFLERIRASHFDLILVSDFISVPELKAGLGAECPPVYLYFHESQLVYPVQNENETDFQYAFSDIMNALHADAVAFNSLFHKNLFQENGQALLKRLPGPLPAGLMEKTDRKSTILYPGIHEIKRIPEVQGITKKPPPLLCWNHRWEYDKNPEDLLLILRELQKKHFSFRLAVLGERYKKAPAVFKTLKEEFHKEIIQFGYLESFDDYQNIVRQSDFILSTSIQENFGISVMEGIAAGGFPVLPDRLSYPELIPEPLHPQCLYTKPEEAAGIIMNQWNHPVRQNLADLPPLIPSAERFFWPRQIKLYDEWFENSQEKKHEQ